MARSQLTAAQARRIAVTAQGFGTDTPRGAVTRAQLRRLIARIQVLQLDSVSVTVRAHYAPVFSRLGPYERELLDRAAWGPTTMQPAKRGVEESDSASTSHTARAPRLLVEYWAHEAALMAVEDWPLLRWRMRRYTHGRWGTRAIEANPRLADDVITAVSELGPATAGRIEQHLAAVSSRAGGGAWWNRTATKQVAEELFATGVLTTATRIGFARHYDLVENVLPAPVLARRVDDDEAVRELVLRAAGALGVGTEADIRDYFRLSAGQARPAIARLVADGELEPVDVAGWTGPGYLRAGQPIPRRDRGTALLCPFDPLIFFRPRVQRLFGFRYRIEIYTPAAARRYGYYVWPLLLDGELVARVDLKADRAHNVLRVVGAFAEDGRPRSRLAAALAGELTVMASWLGLDGVAVGGRGDLAGALRAALRAV